MTKPKTHKETFYQVYNDRYIHIPGFIDYLRSRIRKMEQIVENQSNASQPKNYNPAGAANFQIRIDAFEAVIEELILRQNGRPG